VLASLAKPNFGLSDASEFCLTGECQLTVEVVVSNESSPGKNDGWVTAEVTNPIGNLLFSINGGVIQSGNTFSNLASGDYSLIVLDDAGCTDTVYFTIHSCDLETSITTRPASGGDVGEIHISVTGAIGPVTYSLNGSQFVVDSFFTMLEPGEYIVYTRDSVGCERVDTVIVSTQVSTTFNRNEHFIKIYPNPGKGIYQVSAELNSKDVFIDYQIYNVAGEPVIHGTLAKYDDKHKGEISLVIFPAGVYYASFYVDGDIAVKRIVKTE